jgi:hypothetical protein
MLKEVPAYYVSHCFLSSSPKPTQGCRADDADYYYFLLVIQSTLLVKTVKGKQVNFVIVHAVKACKIGGGITPFILNDVARYR